MPPDAGTSAPATISSFPRPDLSTNSSHTRTHDESGASGTISDPQYCLTRSLLLLHGLNKHIRQVVARQDATTRPPVETFGDPLRVIRQQQRRQRRIRFDEKNPGTPTSSAKDDNEARLVERQMDDVLELLMRGVSLKADSLETTRCADWNLLAALIFVLTACCAGYSVNAATSPSPTCVATSAIAFSPTSPSSPGSTFSASTSMKSRMMAVEGRMERVRHLIESVRELVKETRGDDKPTVRGKRLVSKACEYASAHLGASSGHACECRSFWREVHASKHLEPDEITSFFLLSSQPVISPPIVEEEERQERKISPPLHSRGALSPRDLLGDIKLPFPARTTPPSDDDDPSTFSPPRPYLDRTISRQSSSIFSTNSFSSLFSNPGEGLRQATRSSIALPQLSETVMAQAEAPLRCSTSARRKRSPLAQVWASTSREQEQQETVTDSLSRVRHKYIPPPSIDKDNATSNDTKGLWDTLRRYWRSYQQQDEEQQVLLNDESPTPRMAPRPDPSSAVSKPAADSSIRSPLGRLASVRSPSLHARVQSSPELPALIASGAMLRTPRDWQAQPTLAPLATELRQAEERSKMTRTMTCSVCEKHGVNYPKCLKCGLVFCSRACRVGVAGAGDAKKHVCGLWEERKRPQQQQQVTQRSGIHLGLESMHNLYTRLSPVTTPYIHIAGTNGKGSVSAMVDAACVAAGLRTGRFNSPHLITTSDSICINGKAIDQASYERHLVQVKQAAGGNNNSEFEITTGVAFSVFATSDLDILLIECGMGGLRDATNVLPKDKQVCAVLTAVDLDHQGFLGNTIEEIATDKLGIVKRGGLLVVGEQEHEGVRGIVEQVRCREGAEVAFADASRLSVLSSDARKSKIQAILDEKNLTVDLPLQGPHQLSNLATALQILDVVRSHPRALDVQPRMTQLKDSAISSGIARTRWRGRCDWVDLSIDNKDLIVLTDGAHNASAARHLRDYIKGLEGVSGRITFVLGLSHSPPKTPLDVLRPLLSGLSPALRVLPTLFTTPVEGMPWIKPVAVEEIARAAGECDAEVLPAAKNLEQALQSLLQEYNDGDLVVVTGSLYLVADVYRLEEKDRTIKG